MNHYSGFILEQMSQVVGDRENILENLGRFVPTGKPEILQYAEWNASKS